MWKAPARFLPAGRSIAVFPPIAASTCPTRVVGTWTTGTPRLKRAAVNPARSVAAPPPKPITRERRDSPAPAQKSRARPSWSSSLQASPAGRAWRGRSAGRRWPWSSSTRASAITAARSAASTSGPRPARASAPTRTSLGELPSIRMNWSPTSGSLLLRSAGPRARGPRPGRAPARGGGRLSPRCWPAAGRGAPGGGAPSPAGGAGTPCGRAPAASRTAR